MQVSLLLTKGLLTAMMLAAVAGCATHESAVEADFGKSVRSMVQAQTLEPMESMLPDPDPIDHGNGEQLNNVMEAYKSDVSNRTQAK